jgi:hypothetical protein
MENTIKTLDRWLDELAAIQAKAILAGNEKQIKFCNDIKERIINRKVELEVENGK